MSLRDAALFAEFLDWFAPLDCLGCGDRPVAGAFCASCLRALPWWRAADGCPRCGARWRGVPRALAPVEAEPGAACGRCAAEHSPLDGTLAAFRYAGIWPEALPRAKHGRPLWAPDAATRRLLVFGGEVLADTALDSLGAPLDCVIPIPLHRSREARRGFNQSASIARAFARSLGSTLVEDGLRRTRATRSQAGLAAARRRENLRGAFCAVERRVRGRSVGLVDDVVTTGATLEAGAEALLAAGASSVFGLSLTATVGKPRDAAAASSSPRPRAPIRRAQYHARRSRPAGSTAPGAVADPDP